MSTDLVATGLSIAIAEDDGDLRELLVRFVELLGHQVNSSVGDGRSLVEAVTHKEIDLAIVDFDMPLLDGLAVAEELSTIKRIPIILVSGLPDLTNAVWKREPIADFLSKPVTLDQLDAAICKAQKRGNNKVPVE